MLEGTIPGAVEPVFPCKREEQNGHEGIAQEESRVEAVAKLLKRASPVDDGSRDPSPGEAAVHRDRRVVQDSLKGECRPESCFLDDTLVRQGRVDRRSDPKHPDEGDADNDLFSLQPACCSDEQEGTDGTRENEEEDQNQRGFSIEARGGIAEVGEGNEKRREDKDESPTRKRGLFKAFPEEDRPV